MNRFTCPQGFEDALLRRAEQYEELGAFRKAREARSMAGRTRRTGSRRARQECRALRIVAEYRLCL